MLRECTDVIVQKTEDYLSRKDEFVNLYRGSAGSRLAECKDFNGVLSKYGININGDNEQLSREIYLNVIILMSTTKGDSINLSLDRAIAFGKRDGKLCTKTDINSLCNWADSGFGLGISIVDVEEAEDENGWNTYGEEENEEDVSTEDIEETNRENKEGIEEINKEDEDEDKEVKKDSEIEKEIGLFYSKACKNTIDELKKRYSSLFESGYELIKPSGFLSDEGIISLSGSKRIIRHRNSEITSMNHLFKTKMNYIEMKERSNKKIANIIYNSYTSGRKELLYFPNKLLEYAYGRKAPTGSNQDSLNTYNNHAESRDWNSYFRNEVSKSLLSLVRECVLSFVVKTSKGEGDFFSIEMVDKVSNFLSYFKECLSLSILVVDYNNREVNGIEDLFALKVRVCDPRNSLGVVDMAEVIIRDCFSGANGFVPFSFPPRIEEDTYVKEYAHEFNHNAAQASPLFAYKAFKSLDDQGKKPTWNNMILGMFEDGTILTNGNKGVSLSNKLTHHIAAGSRAGKGVMTMNILASGIYSNKAVFYLDRKPDMASMFKNISSSMFVLTGGEYDANYDKYNQFNNIDSLVNWNNVPDYVTSLLGRGNSWNELGDLFYMRALKLVLGIIVARGGGLHNRVELNKEEGILLVADEFSNFQKGYLPLLQIMKDNLPASNYVSNKIKLNSVKEAERENEENKFNMSYNNSTMYAITYLNSLVADLDFLATKKDAGFDTDEVKYSDIFAIYQNMGYDEVDNREFKSMIADSSSSARYVSSGSKGTKSSSQAKIDILKNSFPLSMINFKTSDAFFGRNFEDGREVYLAQKRPESKANGRLDDKASNFAYLSEFTSDVRNRIVGGNVRDNVEIANRCIYFKPFLVLNDVRNNKSYAEAMFQRCRGDEDIPWVTREDIIAENPNDDKINPYIHDAVGFEDYLRLMGISDYKERLSKSGDIANHVVRNCLGYNGNWFEFITDLRPEWCFTIKDIFDAIHGKTPAVLDAMSNPILKEFVRFNPSLFKQGISNSEDSYDNLLNDSISNSEDLSDISSLQNKDTLIDEDEVSIWEEDEESQDVYQETYKNPYQEVPPEYKLSKEEVDVLMNGLSKEAEIRELEERLAFLKQGLEYPKSESEQAYENDSDYGMKTNIQGNKGYIEYDNGAPSEVFSDAVHLDGSAKSYSSLVNMISAAVVDKFGGLDRIISLRVVGGSIVINGCYFKCKIEGAFAQSIPYDIGREIESGNVAKLFNYNLLRNVPRLSKLEFDSYSFVYDYVSYGMGYGSQISVDLFFRDLKSLDALCIGKKLFRRNNYMELIRNDDIFYKPKMATRFANFSEDFLGNMSRNSWSFTKNTFKSSEYGGVMKFLGVTGGLVATGVSAGGRVAIKGGRGLFSGIKNALSTFKDALEETKR